MGTWGAGIYSDDTAQDLRDEYTCAFYKYSVNEALQKLDEYVLNITEEPDEQLICAYRYSLADYMWKKGILTDEVRDKAIEMIDSGFGLSDWEEAGISALRERKKVLAKLRSQLLTEQPQPKKIKPNCHLTPIFTTGDIIAFRLQTKDKKYSANRVFPMSDEDFRALDGKYIVIQKVGDHIAWHSSSVPDLCDYWARFRLCAVFFDEVPSFEQVSRLPDAAFRVHGDETTPVFHCVSSLVYFRRRQFQLIGNIPDNVNDYPEQQYEGLVFMEINADHLNPDSAFISAIRSAQT